MDDLFASSAARSQETDQSAQNATVPVKTSVSSEQTFPPLPDNAEGRLDLLRAHADALEDLGMWMFTFDQRKTLAGAIRTLRDGSLELRPVEVAELQTLYEELRRGGKGQRN
jgi:hypothetical protein